MNMSQNWPWQPLSGWQVNYWECIKLDTTEMKISPNHLSALPTGWKRYVRCESGPYSHPRANPHHDWIRKLLIFSKYQPKILCFGCPVLEESQSTVCHVNIGTFAAGAACTDKQLFHWQFEEGTDLYAFLTLFLPLYSSQTLVSSATSWLNFLLQFRRKISFPLLY